MNRTVQKRVKHRSYGDLCTLHSYLLRRRFRDNVGITTQWTDRHFDAIYRAMDHFLPEEVYVSPEYME